jgi:hypothetical protein
MKGWCKIIKLKTHDVLVERLYNQDGKESVRLVVQNQDLALIQTAEFDTVEQADEFYAKYDKKPAQKLVDDLNEAKDEERI